MLMSLAAEGFRGSYSRLVVSPRPIRSFGRNSLSLDSRPALAIYWNKERTLNDQTAMASAAAAQAELCRLRRDIARIEGRLAEADRLCGCDPRLGRLEAAASRLKPRRERRGAPAARHRGARHDPRRRPAARHAARDPRRRKPRRRSRGRLRAGARRAARASGGTSSIALDQRSRCAARDGRPLCAGPRRARASIPPRSSRSPRAPRRRRCGPSRRRSPAAALGVGDLRAAAGLARSLRHPPLRAPRPRGGRHRLSPAPRQRRPEPSAAELRFRLSRRRRPATIGRFAAGVGRMAWRLTLEKNRGGPTGAFTVEWNAHERCFAERGERDARRGSSASSCRASPTDRLIRLDGGAASRQPQARLLKARRSPSSRRSRARSASSPSTGIAERRGIRLGAEPRRCARRGPDLVVAEADEAADRALLEEIADWCDRYTPLVALDPPHGLFLDISGCAHLFAARTARRRGGASLRLPRAASPGRALRRGAPSPRRPAPPGRSPVTARAAASPAGAEAEALADLPVAALRIAAEQEALLDRLGLKRIGQLIGKPRAPLAARFGADLVGRLDQALGHEDEVLSPRRPAPRLSAERRFAEPVVDQDSLLETVRLARPHARARRWSGTASARASSKPPSSASTARSRAPASARRARSAPPDTVAMLFAERLSALGSEWDAGFGFDMVRLAVLARRAARRGADRSCRRGGGRSRTSPAWSTGSARGSGRRASPASCRSTRISRARRASPRPLAAPALRSAPAWAAAGGGSRGAARPAAPPLRPPREGGGDRRSAGRAAAPLPLAARAASTWRASKGRSGSRPEWWRAEDDGRATRDYFRVEDAEGRRYWLFREGLYGRETAQPGLVCARAVRLSR